MATTTQQSQNKANSQGKNDQAGSQKTASFAWKDAKSMFDMGGFYEEAKKHFSDMGKMFSMGTMPALKFDQMMGMHKRGVEVLNAAQQVAYENLLAVGRHQVEITQKVAQDFTNMGQLVCSGQSLEVCVAKQIDSAKQTLEAASTGLRELGMIAQKSGQQTMDAFGQYMSQNLDDAKQMFASSK